MLNIFQKLRTENSSIIQRNKFLAFLKPLALIFLVAGLFLFPNNSQASNLNGRILLQVEDNGEAWYVSPIDSYRYYLGRPENAFEIMRKLGLGASDKDIGSFQVSKAPARLAGRILIQVQDKGQAFYVNPLDLKLYYLGRPSDALYLMRSFGLGITNNNLAKIKIASLSPSVPVSSSQIKTEIKPEALIVPPVSSESSNPQTLVWEKNFSKNFNFKYKNKDESLKLDLSSELYNFYQNSPKTIRYSSLENPEDVRNKFYAMFLEIKEGNDSIENLVSKAREVALVNNFSEDETLEYLLAFIQYIPYDHSKIDNGSNTNPFYPYETLYLNRGVCSDKTFLAIQIARELGYGSAVLDLPDLNHSALGISCPLEDSVRLSGYCFVETTNYFPPGVIPNNINNGVAERELSSFDNLFDDALLGKIEIYQKQEGKVYQGMENIKAKVEILKKLSQDIKDGLVLVRSLQEEIRLKEIEINSMKQEMDNYLASGQNSAYNALVAPYNALISEYNSLVPIYEKEWAKYNLNVINYNKLSTDFYQR